MCAQRIVIFVQESKNQNGHNKNFFGLFSSLIKQQPTQQSCCVEEKNEFLLSNEEEEKEHLAFFGPFWH